MDKLVYEKDKGIYNDSNIQYQIRYYFSDAEDVEITEDEIIITAIDASRIDADVIRKIIKENEVGIEVEVSVLKQEKDYLTQQEKMLISSEGNKVLEFVRENSFEDFDNGKVKESIGINLKKGNWLTLYKVIDEALLNIINGIFSADQIEVPNIIDIKELQMSEYLKGSFHHINAVSHMERSYKNIKSFRQMNVNDSINKEFLSTPTQVLNPAVCLHCYPLFGNSNVTDATYVTAIGQSYRDESGNLNNDVRLKEFTMREVVFLGRKSEADYAFERMLQVMDYFGKSLDLNSKLIPSNDIFFDDNIGKKTAFQKALQNKIELEVYDKVLDKNVAIASTNRHGNHFSAPYRIKSNGECAVTMCLAFGYDRIMKVLVDSHATINDSSTETNGKSK